MAGSASRASVITSRTPGGLGEVGEGDLVEAGEAEPVERLRRQRGGCPRHRHRRVRGRRPAAVVRDPTGRSPGRRTRRDQRGNLRRGTEGGGTGQPRPRPAGRPAGHRRELTGTPLGGCPGPGAGGTGGRAADRDALPRRRGRRPARGPERVRRQPAAARHGPDRPHHLRPAVQATVRPGQRAGHPHRRHRGTRRTRPRRDASARPFGLVRARLPAHGARSVRPQGGRPAARGPRQRRPYRWTRRTPGTPPRSDHAGSSPTAAPTPPGRATEPDVPLPAGDRQLLLRR